MKWLARGEPDLPVGDSWLSPGEAARVTGMRFTKRRTEFLVARWTAKEAIGRLVGQERDQARGGGNGAEPARIGPARIEPARIEVRHHVTGAPEAYLDGRPLDVGISLTDRAGWAVCLLCEGSGRVGCDLELVEPRSAGFVRDFSTAAERRLAGTDPLAANLVWSAKESALKVLRTGLRRDTRTVEVTAESGAWADAGRRDGECEWAPLTVRTAEGAVLPGWWRRFGGFLLTVAADRPLPPPVSFEEPPMLSAAVPLHTWLAQPVTSGPVPEAGPATDR